jgi:hypothetical protein
VLPQINPEDRGKGGHNHMKIMKIMNIFLFETNGDLNHYISAGD